VDARCSILRGRCVKLAVVEIELLPPDGRVLERDEIVSVSVVPLGAASWDLVSCAVEEFGGDKLVSRLVSGLSLEHATSAV